MCTAIHSVLMTALPSTSRMYRGRGIGCLRISWYRGQSTKIRHHPVVTDLVEIYSCLLTQFVSPLVPFMALSHPSPGDHAETASHEPVDFVPELP